MQFNKNNEFAPINTCNGELKNIWGEFFKNGFYNGDEIWNYIIYGTNTSVLNTIEETDILHLSKEKKLSIHDVFAYNISDFEPLNSILHNVFHEFIKIHYTHHDNNKFILKINEVDISRGDIILRAIDVLSKLLGQIPFSSDFYEYILSYDLITPSGFYNRYDSKSTNLILQFKLIIDDFKLSNAKASGGDFQRLYIFINQNRDIINNNFEEIFTLDYYTMSFAFFAINFDQINNIHDTLNLKLINFIENNWLNLFINSIRENSSMSEVELKLLGSYILAPNTLLELELSNLFDNKLYKLRSGEYNTTIYSVLNSFESTLSILLPSMYFAFRRVSISSSQCITKLLKLFVNIAPLKLLKMTFDMLNYTYESVSNGVNAHYNFKQDFKYFGIEGKYFIALDILINEYDVIYRIAEEYIEANASTNIFSEPPRKDINEAIDLLDSYTASQFLNMIESIDYLSSSACL